MSGSVGRPGFWQRRQEKMVAEVRRNREGGHRVPTWVMVLTLVAMLAPGRPLLSSQV